MNGWEIMLPTVVAGAGLCAWGALHPASQLFGPTIRRIRHDAQLVLTFDDGPNPALTPQLLDLLERYQARATFFLIGRYVRACPGLAAEIAARGHVLGNHTDTHPSLLWLSAGRIAEQLNRCQEAIEQATGRRARWMRPPYGFRGPQLWSAMRQIGLEGVVMWAVSGRDWKTQAAARVIERLRRAHAGDIVLLHDGDPRALEGDRRHTLAALEACLPRWKDAGLELVTLERIDARLKAAAT